MTDPQTWIVDVDAPSFEQEVIARSASVTVLVSFWAEWCEPCKKLTPRLEEMASKGRFVLAKVNVDNSPDLAQALRVQGIPAVLAIVGGQMVDGFEGALPEDQLTAFLDRIAPAGPAPEADLFAQARTAIEEGKPAEAIGLLLERIEKSPEDSPAKLLLTDLLIDAERIEEAEELFSQLTEEERESAEGKAVAGRLAFANSATDLSELEAEAKASPESFDARFAFGQALVADKRYEEGLEELLETLRIDPAQRGAEAKAAMIEVFDVLGLEDPVANDYRFKLSLELFS